MRPPIVVMGVSGAGKSEVGAALAARLGSRFVDSDSLHPQANVAKMSAGFPLTDEDRWPWLTLVGQELARAEADGIVVACSALKRTYRNAIRAAAPSTLFVHLDVGLPLLEGRVASRPGHFMPSSLLASQLETLEPLAADEPGLSLAPLPGVDITADSIVARLRDRLAPAVSVAGPVQPSVPACDETHEQ